MGAGAQRVEYGKAVLARARVGTLDNIMIVVYLYSTSLQINQYITGTCPDDKCLVCGLVTSSKLEFGALAKSQMTFGENHQMPTFHG
jgi:hypothetical protein